MRQVRVARQIEPRRQPERAPARRAGRVAPSAAGRRSDAPGLLGRLFAPVAELFSLRHPMFLMGVVLSVFALVIVILISGVIGRTIRAVDDAVAASLVRSGFGISSIDITGTGHTTNADVRAALGFGVGVPVFYADLYSAREKLLQLPWVADASVRRVYPGKIDVAVVEKVPYARWQTYGGTFVVDRLGRIITNHGTEQFSRLPLLWGAAAPQVAADFIEAVRRHPAIASKVLAYHYQSERRWNLVLNGFVTVKLPEYGWQKELDELERLIVSNDILSRSLNEIDLRSPTFYYFGNVPVQRQTEVPGAPVATPPDVAAPPKATEEGRAI